MHLVLQEQSFQEIAKEVSLQVKDSISNVVGIIESFLSPLPVGAEVFFPAGAAGVLAGATSRGAGEVQGEDQRAGDQSRPGGRGEGRCGEGGSGEGGGGGVGKGAGGRCGGW